MIKPQELRIGNLVTWKDETVPDNAILTILGMYLNDTIWVEIKSDNGENDTTDCDLDSIKPIPLTEGWLLRFGFTRFRSKGVVGFDYSEPDEYTTWYEKKNITIIQWGGSHTLFFLKS